MWQKTAEHWGREGNKLRANKLRMTMINRIYLNETKQRLARRNIKKEKDIHS